MIAKELEINLHHAFVEAHGKRHPFISVEHLLLAMLRPDAGVKAALASRGVDVDGLCSDLTQWIDEQSPAVQPDREVDTQPTLGFQRVIQRAILKVQASHRPEVTSADVLVAILGEKKSHAVSLLAKYNVTAFDTTYYESHGVAPPSPEPTDAEIGDVGDAAEVQIVFFNDDFTPMEFVVKLLERFFAMNRQDATEVMLEVHRQGSAVCGLYAREVAEPIVKAVLAHARSEGWPLRCAMVVPK